jgi:hypothetical protein
MRSRRFVYYFIIIIISKFLYNFSANFIFDFNNLIIFNRALRSSKKPNIISSDNVYISELIILVGSRFSIYRRFRGDKPILRYLLKILFIIIVFLRIK